MSIYPLEPTKVGNIDALNSPFLHQLTMYVVHARYGLVQATVGVGTGLIWDFWINLGLLRNCYNGGGRYINNCTLMKGGVCEMMHLHVLTVLQKPIAVFSSNGFAGLVYCSWPLSFALPPNRVTIA